jgi:hypothetical protein
LQHFSALLSTPAIGHLGIDWQSLEYVPQDLSELDVEFDEQEIKEAIFSLPSVKAPGPDSFIGAFFKSCWDII